MRGALAALLGLGVLAAQIGARRAHTDRRDVHKRGTVIERAANAQRLPLRQKLRYLGPPGRQPVFLAGRALEFAEETKHFKLIGTTGTGKTTAIVELLGSVLERGDRAVVTDPEGGYRRRFHDRQRGDVILNPFDAASVKWDPFAEIRHDYDVEQLVSGLIPSTDDAAGREWRGYARTFLTAITRRCYQLKKCDAGTLWRMIAIASSRELRGLVAGTPAQPFLEPENARMLGSIRSVAASAAAALDIIQAQQGVPFSVREWVRKGRGVLFIPYQADQVAALRSAIAAWVRLAIFETMSQGEGDQRLWFVMDELDAIGAIDGLKDALARLRKFGGRCVLGLQSAAQVTSTYGSSDAQTVLENCGNTLILRCSGSEPGGTAYFASRLIGEREVIRRQTSRGQDREGLLTARAARRSTQISAQHVTEIAVMASELEQLPDLSGYLKTAGERCWRRVTLARR